MRVAVRTSPAIAAGTPSLMFLPNCRPPPHPRFVTVKKGKRAPFYTMPKIPLFLPLLLPPGVGSAPPCAADAQTPPLPVPPFPPVVFNTPPLGAAAPNPPPKNPTGWGGDWPGRSPGAAPPLHWSRRVKGLTSELHCQARKPAGEPNADSPNVEY